MPTKVFDSIVYVLFLSFLFIAKSTLLLNFSHASAALATEPTKSPSGVSKRRAISQAKKDENDKGVDELSEKDDGAVEVAESRFPATSIPKVMEAVESLPEFAPNSNLWWFAKGLFSSQEKREMFSKVDDPGCKLQFLMNERSRA